MSYFLFCGKSNDGWDYSFLVNFQRESTQEKIKGDSKGIHIDV